MNYYAKMCAGSTLIAWALLLACGILEHTSMVASFVGSAATATWLWWRKG